jgi:hypothetical protein
MEIQVPTIFDPEYASIASHQSSWVSYEIAKNINKLRKYYEEENIEEFKNVYKECLLNGSQLRAKLGIKPCGENIDDDILLDYYYDQNYVHVVIRKGIYNNEDLIPKEYLPENFYKFYKDEYYTIKESNAQLQRLFKELIYGLHLLVSSNGKTFTIISFKYYGKYMICDPFSSKLLILNEEEVIDYILKDSREEYLFIKLFRIICMSS